MNLHNHFRFLCYISQCEDCFCSARHKKTNKSYSCLLHQSWLIFVSPVPLPPQPHCCLAVDGEADGLVKRRWMVDRARQVDLWAFPLQAVFALSANWARGKFFVLSKAASHWKREKWEGGALIKIQLSLTFSLLPFQSFYSFKSLTISMKLKGSASHLWNSDTFDNNAFEELVTSSSQISLINAQTVSLFSLLLFSWFLSN